MTKACLLCPNDWRFSYAWSVSRIHGKYNMDLKKLIEEASSEDEVPAHIREDVFEGFIYKDDTLAIFTDVDKDSPTHLLIVPIEHLEDLYILGRPDLLMASMCAAEQLVEISEVPEAYISISSKKDGTSYVPHSHIHVQSQSIMGVENMELPHEFYKRSKYYKEIRL